MKKTSVKEYVQTRTPTGRFAYGGGKYLAASWATCITGKTFLDLLDIAGLLRHFAYQNMDELKNHGQIYLMAEHAAMNARVNTIEAIAKILEDCHAVEANSKEKYLNDNFLPDQFKKKD